MKTEVEVKKKWGILNAIKLLVEDEDLEISYGTLRDISGSEENAKHLIKEGYFVKNIDKEDGKKFYSMGVKCIPIYNSVLNSQTMEKSNFELINYTILLLIFAVFQVMMTLTSKLNLSLNTIFLTSILLFGIMLTLGLFILIRNFNNLEIKNFEIKKNFPIKSFLMNLSLFLILILGVSQGGTISFDKIHGLFWIFLFFALSIWGIKYLKPPWLKKTAKILIILLGVFFIVSFILFYVGFV